MNIAGYSYWQLWNTPFCYSFFLVDVTDHLNLKVGFFFLLSDLLLEALQAEKKKKAGSH